MSKTKSVLAAAGLVAMVAAMTACHEPVSVTVYEPGEYKGARDSLLKQHAKPEQKEALQKRFAMGQSDR